jgi:hypothetical protein
MTHDQFMAEMAKFRAANPQIKTRREAAMPVMVMPYKDVSPYIEALQKTIRMAIDAEMLSSYPGMLKKTPPDPKFLAMQRATNFLSAQRRPDGRPSVFQLILE